MIIHMNLLTYKLYLQLEELAILIETIMCPQTLALVKTVYMVPD